MMIVRHATEEQLRKEAERLRALIKKKAVTLAEANRLAEIEAALRRIDAVREGRALG